MEYRDPKGREPASVAVSVSALWLPQCEELAPPHPFSVWETRSHMASSSGVVYIRPSISTRRGLMDTSIFMKRAGKVVIRGMRGSDNREPAQPAVRVAIKLS